MEAMMRCAMAMVLVVAVAGPGALGQEDVAYGYCHIKYGSDGVVAKDGSTMCVVGGNGTCTFTANTDVENVSGGYQVKADGVEQCCAACRADSRCKAAVHVKNWRAGKTCSSNILHGADPATERSKCEGFKSCGYNCGVEYSYPSQFPILNEHTWYVCPRSGKRIVVSNGIPDHTLKVYNPNDPCTGNWHVEVALHPKYLEGNVTELRPLGAIAMQLNGVPMYGAQEDPFDGDSNNAVQPPSDAKVVDGGHWFGHTSPQKQWHYHAPFVGHATYPASTTQVGYALDGFPIYGPVDDQSLLDECNGRFVNGAYQYHTRRVEDVNATVGGKVRLQYCDGFSPACNWRYILGCYHGDVSGLKIADASTTSLPSDCVKDEATHALEVKHVSHLGGRVILHRQSP